MSQSSNILEYKCPCCNAGLSFGANVQKMTCEYCDNEFDLETIRTLNEGANQGDSTDFVWEESQTQEWADEEQQQITSYTCPSCAGELLTDANTVATFCPYCDNPSVMPGRVSGGLRPDGVIPFRTSKEDAKTAFLNLCKNKPLLPKMFTSEQQLEKITGMYVPFWLYDCSSDLSGQYRATRVHRWSDRNYNYTRTEHFMLTRDAGAAFSGIPMDASSKMDNVFMESIEPFDYTQIVDFDTAYLSGYLADKYDVESSVGEERIRQRVSNSMDELLRSSFTGYATVTPTSRQLKVKQGKARYVLIPVWMLNTKYRDKIYTFAMNGQSGKMTGSFPICPKRAAGWFAAIALGVSVAATLLQFIML